MKPRGTRREPRVRAEEAPARGTHVRMSTGTARSGSRRLFLHLLLLLGTSCHMLHGQGCRVGFFNPPINVSPLTPKQPHPHLSHHQLFPAVLVEEMEKEEGGRDSKLGKRDSGQGWLW
ncbi:hypothetical protein FQA47_009159 [Oryzias melastigma]|uniref:Uncharacterized protein n=1 Tax=Oryzias melastigma TaxID=30732 RepID=A0A834KZF7_ORYME|nr:hypothetical protein FQA47_009159 [Oryzias melastigma]